MPLSQAAIDELKVIYRKHYGEELPDDEAWAMGHRLLRAFDVLTRVPAKQSLKDAGSNSVPFDRT